jgi:hypothetical protein
MISSRHEASVCYSRVGARPCDRRDHSDQLFNAANANF